MKFQIFFIHISTIEKYRVLFLKQNGIFKTHVHRLQDLADLLKAAVFFCFGIKKCHDLQQQCEKATLQKLVSKVLAITVDLGFGYIRFFLNIFQKNLFCEIFKKKLSQHYRSFFGIFSDPEEFLFSLQLLPKKYALSEVSPHKISPKRPIRRAKNTVQQQCIKKLLKKFRNDCCFKYGHPLSHSTNNFRQQLMSGAFIQGICNHPQHCHPSE